MNPLPRRAAIAVFLAFAFAYFLSALLRAVTATLSPTLTQAFGLQARDLGLLAGGYFLGFALTQLPMGRWLDEHGPRRVVLGFLALAVAGCLLFAWADSFGLLLAARVLGGIGVSACLMAPLTGYRRWFDATAQLRANSWMLMTGSLGMIAATLPVQWLLPVLGWRPLFVGLAALIAVSMLFIAWKVPPWTASTAATAATAAAPAAAAEPRESLWRSYAPVWQNPYFRRMVPIGFFSYGGLVAVQTLWAGPWMVRVGGYSANDAAVGLFWINVTMLLTFWTWGLVTPALWRRAHTAEQLIQRALPASFVVLAGLIAAGPALGGLTTAGLALFCLCCSVVSLAQPAVGMAFPSALAGRALSAYNLVIFAGVFVVQWGIGLIVDAIRAFGGDDVTAFRGALAVFLACCVASYLHFWLTAPDNARS